MRGRARACPGMPGRARRQYDRIWGVQWRYSTGFRRVLADMWPKTNATTPSDHPFSTIPS